ncbi:MAG TPA: beta-propeller fold lactonase family protein [Verrucomicrobiae bacterium]|nr:beta-propeller fold lactonase family protein [Verrucomicrobiae bacterium]
MRRYCQIAIDAASGELTSRGQTPTEKTPRSFCLMPGGDDFVVSAGEGSHRLIVYRRDRQSGALMPIRAYDCGKAPAWVLDARFE